MSDEDKRTGTRTTPAHRAVKAVRALREQDLAEFAQALGGASPMFAREIGRLLLQQETQEAP